MLSTHSGQSGPHSGNDSVDAMLEDGKNLLKNEAYQEAVEQFTLGYQGSPKFR